MKKECFKRDCLRIIPIFILAALFSLFYAEDASSKAMSNQEELIAKQQAFKQVFGDAVILDPAMVQKVKD